MSRKMMRKSTLGSDIAALERERSSFKPSVTQLDRTLIEDSNDTIESKFKTSSKKNKLQMSLLGIGPNNMSHLDYNSDDEAGETHVFPVQENMEFFESEEDKEDMFDAPFESAYAPSQMRCLALVAHNHMKPAMKQFVLANKNLLKKFRLTGTNTTMTMLREVFGNDPSVEFGPTCTSGPLGGDAELVAVMCTENLGGCVFFQDPMSAHPHTADIECLNRQANVHNIVMMPNPATAFAVLSTLRIALKEGRDELIPSFFQTLESPSVAEYKVRQAKVVEKNKN